MRVDVSVSMDDLVMSRLQVADDIPSPARDFFTYDGPEHVLTYEVNEVTGDAYLVEVDGRSLS